MRKIFLSLILIAASPLAFAQATVRWDGGGDGTNWNDAANWDTDSVPAAGDFVEFASNVTVTGAKPPAPRRIDVIAGNTVTFDMNLDIGDGVIEEHALKAQNNATINLGTAGGNRVFNIQVGGNKEGFLQNANPGPATINIASSTTVNMTKARYGVWSYNGDNAVNNAGTLNISGVLQDGIRLDTGSFTNQATGVIAITDPLDDGIDVTGAFENLGSVTIALPAGAGTGKNNVLALAGGTVTNRATMTMTEGNEPRRIVASGGTITNEKGARIDLGDGRLRNELGGTFTNNGLIVSTFTAAGLPAAGVFGTADAGTSTNNAFYDWGDTDGSIDFGGGTLIVDNGVNVDPAGPDMTVDAASSCTVADLGIDVAYDWYKDAANSPPMAGSNDASGALTFGAEVFPAAGSQTIYTLYGGDVAFTVENVDGTCVVKYAVKANVSGLTGTLVLQNNGGDDLTVTTNGVSTFATKLNAGDAYDVTVLSQPAGQNCSVTSPTGTIPVPGADVTVSVSCSDLPTYTIGGTVSGLAGTLVLQNNGGDNLSVTADGNFTFATGLLEGATYNVTVLSEPADQACTVTNGSGTVGTNNVTDVTVTCAGATKYSVGGTLSNLAAGESVTLLNNGTDSLPLSANGNFTFANTLLDGASYTVTVAVQPATQDCAVTNGSGTIATADATNVAVDCVDVPTYTVGGTISGLSGSVTLQNNGGDDLVVSADGAFTFATPLKVGATYDIRVSAQPAGQSCQVVSGGTGTITGAPIDDVAVECTDRVTPPPIVGPTEAVPTLSRFGLLVMILTLGLAAIAYRRYF